MCGLAALLSGVEVDCSTIPQPGDEAAPCAPCAAGPPDAPLLPEGLESLEAGLRRRGPDGSAAAAFELRGWCRLSLRASLLQLRGDAPAEALRRHDDGSALCFNGASHPPCAAPAPRLSACCCAGEVFGGLAVPEGGSDSAALLAALTAAGADVSAVLSTVRGPWALAFFHAPSETLWFGRDVLGRRSLLLRRPQAGQEGLVLASVAPLAPPGSPPWVRTLRISRLRIADVLMAASTNHRRSCHLGCTASSSVALLLPACGATTGAARSCARWPTTAAVRAAPRRRPPLLQSNCCFGWMRRWHAAARPAAPLRAMPPAPAQHQ